MNQKKKDKVIVHTDKKIGATISDVGPGGKESNVKKIDEEEHLQKGKFTEWCKKNGFKDGPSSACAKKAMSTDSVSAHKMATFYTNTDK